MMRAGYAKAYVPGAAVLHSHAYSSLEQLRRSFDEWRGLREVYGWREPARAAPRAAASCAASSAHARRELRARRAARARRATLAE